MNPTPALLDACVAIDDWRAQVRAAFARTARTARPLAPQEADRLLEALAALSAIHSRARANTQPNTQQTDTAP